MCGKRRHRRPRRDRRRWCDRRGGFVFIGLDKRANQHAVGADAPVRGTDYVITEFIQITRQFLGKGNDQRRYGEAWINSFAYKLRDHKAGRHILGYAPKTDMFKLDKNSPENIRAATLTLDIGIEPAPGFKVAHHNIRRYRPAVEGLVGDIISRLAAAA